MRIKLASVPVQLALSIAISAVILTGGMQIASAQQVPTQVNPGSIIQPEDKQQLRDQGQIDRQQQIKPETENTKIEVPEAQKPAPAVESPRFTVNSIQLEGNTIFSNEELQPILAKYEGHEVTLDDLGKAVDEINQKYRDKGYLTSQAYVPPQDIENGTVKIQIVEGHVGQIEISGNRHYRTCIIARSLEYGTGDTLNVKDLEDTLNRQNQLSNYRLKAVLKAGAQTGETDINFQVAERQPWQISPTWDNQGRPFVGLYREGVEVQNQNLLGIGDRLFLKWLQGQGSGGALTEVGVGSYTIPLNRFGTELGYNYSFSYVNVALPNAPNTRIQGFAHNHTLTLSQPLDKQRIFVLDASFNARRVRSYLDRQEETGDRAAVDVRSMALGLNINKLDRWGRTFVRLQTDVAPKSWLGSNQAFWKASTYGTRLQRLPLNSLLILRASAQFSPDALPAIEQYQLGGAFSVRGYTEGLLIGDRGYNLSAEVRWPIPGLKYLSYKGIGPWLNDRVQGVYFVDMGQVFTNRNNPTFVTSRPGFPGSSSGQRTTLVGTGLGVRARLTRFMIGFADFGWGLSNQGNIEPTAQPTVRVHFGLRSDLLPETLKTHDTPVHKLNTTPKKLKKQPPFAAKSTAAVKPTPKQTIAKNAEKPAAPMQVAKAQPDVKTPAVQQEASVFAAQAASPQTAQQALPASPIAQQTELEQSQRQQLQQLLDKNTPPVTQPEE